LSEKNLAAFRSHKLGIVFQQFHLMPHLTAYENVSLPLEILGEAGDDAKTDAKIKDVLEMVGLASRLHHLPSQLSGGEQQRVAIARAIVHNPRLLLADEPSGNLDVETGAKVMDLIFSLVEKQKLTLLLVTHDARLAERCQRKIFLKGSR
jgi:putative ABC transport system ATP-binding protein